MKMLIDVLPTIDDVIRESIEFKKCIIVNHTYKIYFSNKLTEFGMYDDFRRFVNNDGFFSGLFNNIYTSDIKKTMRVIDDDNINLKKEIDGLENTIRHFFKYNAEKEPSYNNKIYPFLIPYLKNKKCLTRVQYLLLSTILPNYIPILDHLCEYN